MLCNDSLWFGVVGVTLSCNDVEWICGGVCVVDGGGDGCVEPVVSVPMYECFVIVVLVVVECSNGVE